MPTWHTRNIQTTAKKSHCWTFWKSLESLNWSLTQTACQTATPYLLSVLFPCFSQWSSISGAKPHWLPLPTPPFCHDGSSLVLSSSPPPPLSPVNNRRDFWRGEKWEKRGRASRSRAEQKKKWGRKETAKRGRGKRGYIKLTCCFSSPRFPQFQVGQSSGSSMKHLP